MSLTSAAASRSLVTRQSGQEPATNAWHISEYHAGCSWGCTQGVCICLCVWCVSHYIQACWFLRRKTWQHALYKAAQGEEQVADACPYVHMLVITEACKLAYACVWRKQLDPCLEGTCADQELLGDILSLDVFTLRQEIGTWSCLHGTYIDHDLLGASIW